MPLKVSEARQRLIHRTHLTVFFTAVSNKLRSKEDLVSIHNGCVCCSLRKDIVSALAELSRRSEQAGRRYDNIILETTGLADPAPVAFTFFSNSWAKRRFHLDSIVYALPASVGHTVLPPTASLGANACAAKNHDFVSLYVFVPGLSM